MQSYVLYSAVATLDVSLMPGQLSATRHSW